VGQAQAVTPPISDLADWVRRAAAIEAVAPPDRLRSEEPLHGLRGDIEGFVASPGDAPLDSVALARDIASLLDRLALALASGHVQSITGLQRPLGRLKSALEPQVGRGSRADDG
jgi:hypothetical protein